MKRILGNVKVMGFKWFLWNRFLNRKGMSLDLETLGVQIRFVENIFKKSIEVPQRCTVHFVELLYQPTNALTLNNTLKHLKSLPHVSILRSTLRMI